MNNRGQFKGHILSLLCVIAWGTSFLVSKNLIAIISPVQLMFLRFVIAWLAIWVIYPKWFFHWREEGPFIVLSLFGNTLYYLSENTALKLTLASNVSILVSAAPIASALMLRVFGNGERLSHRQTAGIGIAFFGVLLVVFNGVFVLELNPLGDLLAMAAAVCWALYGFLAKRIIDRYDTFLSTRKLMFYGILTTIPLLIAEGRGLSGMTGMQAGDICGLLYLGLICSAVCYLMWNKAISIIGAMKANLYVYAVPVVTMIASAVFLEETVSPVGLFGVVMVIGGMLLSNLNGRLERPAEENTVDGG
ncbi:MAG: DMT family transporter [Oscillospiraceae bacterium]|nr:DMT family transporter [Oscillospiraceae bacterium]